MNRPRANKQNSSVSIWIISWSIALTATFFFLYIFLIHDFKYYFSFVISHDKMLVSFAVCISVWLWNLTILSISVIQLHIRYDYLKSKIVFFSNFCLKMTHFRSRWWTRFSKALYTHVAYVPPNENSSYLYHLKVQVLEEM